MKKKNQGFTLVELLVAISILGIIMVFALPQISNIQTKNKTTKYEKYAETMLSSGKLYVDSYTEDMFGNNTSGCYDITYKELKDKSLVKDIKVDGATCSSDDTFIRVRKSNDHYTYETSIYCTDKNGNEVYNQVLTKISCDGTSIDELGPTIKISPNSHDWTTGKDEKVTISISDDYGMLENAKIEYTWTTTPDSPTDFKTYSFKNKRYEGTTSSPLKYEVELPQNATGIYYLIVRPADVRDANGNYQTSIVRSKEFKLDNTAPDTPTIINPSNEEWTNTDFALTVSSTDTDSGINYWRYKYDKESWEKYSDSKTDTFTTPTFTDEQDRYIYISVCDLVGNCSESAKTKIRIDKGKPTAPTVALVKSDCTEVSNNTWHNFDVYVSGSTDNTKAFPSSTDTASGIAKYQISTDNSTWVDWSYSATSTTYYLSATGTYYRYVRAVDEAGNISDVTTKTIKVDKTPPTITEIDNPTNGEATISSFSLTLTGEDKESGIAKWRYKYADSKDWTDYKDSALDTFTTTSFSKLRNEDVYISACDKVGNCSDALTTRIHIVDICSSTKNVYLSDWAWSTCTKTCDGGTQYQYRNYEKVSTYDETHVCETNLTEYASQNTQCSTTPCYTDVNKIKYADCKAYYITKCNSTTCEYSQVDGTAKTGTIDKNKLTDSLGTECCSVDHPTACKKYHSCRPGNTTVYSSSTTSNAYEGVISNTQEIYIIKTVGKLYYIYVPDGGKFNNPWYDHTENFGYIYTNCVKEWGETCEEKDCPDPK